MYYFKDGTLKEGLCFPWFMILRVSLYFDDDDDEESYLFILLHWYSYFVSLLEQGFKTWNDGLYM